MNRIVMHNVVVSYFHDVDRHKDFHGTERVDQIKQAAFAIKWIAKLRRIQIRLGRWTCLTLNSICQ